MVYICVGHNVDNLAPLAIPLRIEKYPTWQMEASSDGILRKQGGAEAALIAEALTYAEAVPVLDQLGLSMATQSSLCTVVFPDYHRYPTPFYGIVDLDVTESEGDWWKNFRLKFRRLTEVT